MSNLPDVLRRNPTLKRLVVEIHITVSILSYFGVNGMHRLFTADVCCVA